MRYAEALTHIKLSPGVIGMRHPDMGPGWLIFWSPLEGRPDLPDGGFTYHLNPHTLSEPCFPIKPEEMARDDWRIVTRK